jgi:hypothetical protein
MLSREGGVEREGGVAREEAVEREGGVGVGRPGEDLREGPGEALPGGGPAADFLHPSGRRARRTALPRFPIDTFLCLELSGSCCSRPGPVLHKHVRLNSANHLAPRLPPGRSGTRHGAAGRPATGLRHHRLLPPAGVPGYLLSNIRQPGIAGNACLAIKLKSG